MNSFHSSLPRCRSLPDLTHSLSTAHKPKGFVYWCPDIFGDTQCLDLPPPRTVYERIKISAGEIRLVLILPDPDPEATPICLLTKAALKNAPKFSALSYAWGSKADFAMIGIGAELPSYWYDYGSAWTTVVHEKQLRSDLCMHQVTRNLFTALKHLRHPEETKVLWIDALCINQADSMEKDHQVRQMAQIYGSAEEVLVWLGEGANYSDLVMELMNNFNNFNTFDLSDIHKVENLYTSIEELSRRPWWSRRWILQEVASAKQVVSLYCGKQVAPLSDAALNLEALITFLPTYDTRASSAALIIRLLRVHMSARGLLVKLLQLENLRLGATLKNATLTDVLRYTGCARVTDPRDNVYALLGMTASCYQTDILIDYTLEYGQVYKNATLSMIKNTRNLDIFMRYPDRDQVLPSWVLDFSQIGDYFHNRLDPQNTTASYWVLNAWESHKASRSVKCLNIGLEPLANMLSLQGVLLDTIEVIKSPTSGRGSHEIPMFAALSEILRQFDDNRDLLPRNISTDCEEKISLIEEILIKSAVMGMSGYSPPSSGVSDFDWAVLHIYIQPIIHGLQAFSNRSNMILWNITSLKKHKKMWEEYLKAFSMFWRMGMTYFITKSGYVGSCTMAELQQGDTVTILFGANMPIILRPVHVPGTKQGDKLYRYVGLAYVYGIMDGEFLPEDESEARSMASEFRLC